MEAKLQPLVNVDPEYLEWQLVIKAAEKNFLKPGLNLKEQIKQVKKFGKTPEDALKFIEIEEHTINKNHHRSSSQGINYELIHNNMRDLLDETPYLLEKSGTLWRWNELGYYELANEEDIVFDINKRFGAFEALPSTIRSSYITSLKIWAKQDALTIIPEPESKTALELYHCVSFKDKTINFGSGIETNTKPSLFITNPIPWKLGTSSNTSHIDSLFEQWCPGKSTQLKDICAYSLLNHNNQKMIFFYYGQKNSGKTQFCKVLSRFLGGRNVLSSNFSLLTDPKQRFELINLQNKKAVFCSELDDKEFYQTSILKQISGMDPLRGERKGVQGSYDFTFNGKAHIATNTLPQVKDSGDDAFFGRCVIIDFNQVFSPGIYAPSDQVPEYEFENLASFCVDRIKEWYANKSITISGLPDFDARIRVFKNKSNPLMAFIERYCEFDTINEPDDSDYFIFSWELGEKFRAWQKDHNYKEWDNTKIGTTLNEQFKNKCKRKSKLNPVSKKPNWGYAGLRLKIPDIPVLPGVGIGNHTRENETQTPVLPVEPVNSRPKSQILLECFKRLITDSNTRKAFVTDLQQASGLSESEFFEADAELKLSGQYYEPIQGIRMIP